MATASEKAAAGRQKAWIKMTALVLFIVSTVLLYQFTSLKAYLTSDVLGQLLGRAGIWAPIVFIVIYAVGVCFFIPATLFTVMGGAIFGPYWGFVYVWLGAMLGAAGGFVIGRTLGRDFAASLIGDRLKKYDDAIERNGFATVLYLRLVYFPFTPMNFGMGLTRVRFSDFMSGTGLGIIVGTFIFVFFVGTIKEIWASGDWADLISFKVFFSVGLFIFSFFIPKIIKRIKGE